MRRTVPALALAALLVVSGVASAAASASEATRRAHDVPARIVVRPQVGIAGVKLGDRPAAVRARLGAPVRIDRDDQGFLVSERWFYRGLRIGLIGGPDSLFVLEATTTSPRARTPRGVGVGSWAARVRRDYPAARCSRRGRGATCAIGEPGTRQTGFVIRRERVRTIFVADVF